MDNEVRFGLVGKNISYSFSKKYFEEKFRKLMLQNYRYDLFDIPEIKNIEEIFKIDGLQGFNVTIPYKEQIIPYLDELSDEAQKIGAVNTVLIKNGKKVGYNTDAAGFEKSLKLLLKNQTKALILGDGGAAKAVAYVLSKNGISHQTVSRKSELNFDNLTAETVAENKIIIQCTPVGTFPDTQNCLKFPFEGISEEHLVIDLIYNPDVTIFLKEAGKKGAQTLNGLYMLEQQAEKAWEIWKNS